VAVAGVASALLAWSLALVANGTAADEDKELKGKIEKLADAEGSKDPGARQQAAAIAKAIDEVSAVMDLMKPGKDGGLDSTGIEKRLIAMGKKPLTAPQVASESDGLAKLGNQVAAIAEVARVKCPVQKKEGAKDPKDWDKWCAEMNQAAQEFAAAAKAKDAAKLKTVTNKLNSTCSECHAVFRD
jgi:hypothetical protein